MAFAKVAAALCVVALTAPVTKAQDANQAVLAKMANATFSPVQKVVMLLQNMKKTVDKDAEDDKLAYDKYMCWCETNEKEKTAAIEAAEEQIDSLEAFVEEAVATESELKSYIEGLKESIAEDKEALASARALRQKEHKEYEDETGDLKESIGLLKQAVEVLSKVQFTQKGGGSTKESAAALIQVRDIIEKKLQRFPHFKSVMQKDLFDIMGSLNDLTSPEQPAVTSGIIMGEAFLPKRDSDAVALEQTKLLPWEKSEEQKGMEAKPNDLEGAAAGAKSYNARSGSIFGMLEQMQETFEKDLAKAEKAEAAAQKEFEELSAAKMGEIKAASQQLDEKEAALADLVEKKAKAEEDIEATKKAMEADQEFLLNLQKNCKIVDAEYHGRVEVRSQEIEALAETIQILTSDDARDLIQNTMSFMQISSNQRAAAAARERAFQRAMKRIAMVANQHRSWALASLAVRARLDKFTKVKEMMDKMLAELKMQQKAEYEKWEFCKKTIDETEDKIKEEQHEKEDLAEKHEELSNTLSVLTEDIKNLKKEVEDMEVSLKKAGIDRHAENEVFQAQVADQRAMVNILNMAYARLAKFYTPGVDPNALPGAPAPVILHDRSGSLVQVFAHAQSSQAPPPKPESYEKHGSSGGVMQLMATIIQDAEVEEQELVQTEQKAQGMYGEFVKDASNSIEADRAAIAEKEQHSAATSEELSETEAEQLANDAELEKAHELMNAHHLECDFLLKYFGIRQKSRAEEMESITDAKAILAGANFGANEE